MDKKYTAEEVFEIIKKQMENDERWKFLSMMYDEYYNPGKTPKADNHEIDY